MEGNLCFKIDWASLIVGSKFTVFALFYFVFEGNSKYKPVGGLYLKGQLKGGFFALPFGGLIFGGTYTWRGLFLEFYSMRLEPVLPILCLVGILPILCFLATAFSLESVFYCNCASNQFFIGTESSHADTRKECASVTLSNVERCMHLLKNGMDVFFLRERVYVGTYMYDSWLKS